jgi:uncharacterized protein YecT (DUF1311 family)
MRAAASALLSLALFTAATAAHGQAASSAPTVPTASAAPADQACDANKLSTNDYETCLQQAEAKFDKDLTALMASIPQSAKVKTDIVGPDVAASARALWRKNFVALAAAFRAYRDKDCEDASIAEMGYGNGGLQWRLACQINETSRQIDMLKKRYGLN